MLKQISSITLLTQALLLFIIVSFSVSNSATAQTNNGKPLPPMPNQYSAIAALSGKPQPGQEALDKITFPIEKMSKGFYRALKLRAVYIDVPMEHFKIPDFPANSSIQTKAELDYIHKLQQERTPETILAAQRIAGVSFNPFIHPSDSTYSYYRKNLFHIGHSMGPWFNETNLPKTANLIANVWQDQLHYMWAFKFKYNRARPVALDPRIKNLENTMWPAYPSGHATFSWTNAFLLEELFPEYKDAIYKDAYETAHSREILGVHFPSDSESSRILSRQLINEMLKSEKFKKDLAAAKEEIEKVKPKK